MWTSPKSKKAEVSSRPLRAAYLIHQEPDHVLLDVLFAESMSRWGGRRTPIISTNGKSISNADWLFLDIWDADVIYSYVELDEELHNKIAFELCPSRILTHVLPGKEPTRHNLTPRIDETSGAISSISILPLLARQREIRNDTLLDVLDKERYCDVPRDLSDTFGFLSEYGADKDLTPYARRMCFKEESPDRNYAERFSEPTAISYVRQIEELENLLSQKHSLHFVSQLSDMLCPSLNIFQNYQANWEDRLTIVVGNSVDDRLIFWNAIHRYKSLDTFRNAQILRFEKDRFENGIPEWIKPFCSGLKNHRHSYGNQAPNIQIISSSIEENQLFKICEQVKDIGHIQCSVSKLHASDIFEPIQGNDPREEYLVSATMWSAWDWPTPISKQTTRVNEIEIDLPCLKPWHLVDFPLGPTTVGTWVSDLWIERTENHSRDEHITHYWMFPRRLALHKSIYLKNYGPQEKLSTVSYRTTERGKLSLHDDAQWPRPTIQLANDLRSFRQAVSMHHPNTTQDHDALRGDGRTVRFEKVALSKPGVDLLGVFQFFNNLHEAFQYLTNDFLLKLIASLSPSDVANDKKRISKMAIELKSFIQRENTSIIDFDRLSKRVLELSARWVEADARLEKHVSFFEISSKLPSDARNNEGRSDLRDCIKYLRNVGVLKQGYGWKCNYCGHNNWMPLQNISETMNCEICDQQENAPVSDDKNIHFMLSQFVRSAFKPTSSQGPVIWALSVLANEAKHSFMMVPTIDILDEVNLPNGTDIDVLVSIDGKVHIYEVKSSFGGVDKKQVDDLLAIASHIRPDYIGFAVQQTFKEGCINPDWIISLKEELGRLGVEYRLITSDQSNGLFHNNGIPYCTGETMKWNIW